MATISGQVRKFRHKSSSQSVLFGDTLDHVFEEGMAVCRYQCTIKELIHLTIDPWRLRDRFDKASNRVQTSHRKFRE